MVRTSLKHCIARRLAAPLPALALLATGTAVNAQPALPGGGTVVAGSAIIGAPAAADLTVTQSSARAIVDWGGFSVGQGGRVRFDNGAGATLNRVTGSNMSSIDGTLSASGSVYLINPHGVVIGTSGVVNVGGSFVATTLGIGNDAFMAGGDLAFAGESSAAVINLGKVGALGGDVGLIASRVENRGTINAASGTAGLLAGTDVLLRDAALDGGRFVVRVGGGGTSATNAGTIAAAAAELRANGGNVYALAGDTGGVVRADGVAEHDGRIWLTAGDAGTVQVAGTLTARGAGDAPGTIETSGGTVRVGAATIDAGVGGTWLLDPTDLTIDQAVAATIAGALNAGTNVTQQTSAAGTGGVGDITVSPNVAINWTTGAGLTLSAYRNIAIGAGTKLTSTGGGAVTLYADNTGTGTGTVSFGSDAKVTTAGAVNIFYDPASNPAGSSYNVNSYASPASYASFVSGGGALSAYMLVNTASDLSNIRNNLAGTYALGRDIDEAGVAFVPIGEFLPFSGTFDGQGHALANLTITEMDSSFNLGVGLFGHLSGVVRNLNLLGGSISSVNSLDYTTSTYGMVGSVVGIVEKGGTISNVSSSAAVSGAAENAVGGLVGSNAGTIANSYASGSVAGTTTVRTQYTFPCRNSCFPITTYTYTYTNSVGGLVGRNSGTIVNAYATGQVSGGATNAGGFVGMNSGAIGSAYASGAASGGGGFAGSNASGGTITDSYWDQTTTGQQLGYTSNNGLITRLVGIGGDTGFSPYAQSTYTHFTFGAGGTWVMFDGKTRPILQSEYSTTVRTPHQIQLIATNLGASYTLASDIDLSATATGSDIWNPATGFAPIGSDLSASLVPFSGKFDGAGHSISGLTITADSYVGLFGSSAGSIENVSLLGGNVNGGTFVGALVGENLGRVSNSSASTAVTGGVLVGGLVGQNGYGDGRASASVSGSSASGTVTGYEYVGGLIGGNTASIVSSSYASGTVTGLSRGQGMPSGYVGGLIGRAEGTITDVYATGAVSGGGGFAGGLIGLLEGTLRNGYATGLVNGSGGLVGLTGNSYAISNSYWDIGTTRQGNGVGFGANRAGSGTAVGSGTSLNPYTQATYAGFDFSATGPWVILEASTRPLLRSEYSTRITSAHQLQLITTNPYVDYTLAANIDLAVTANPSDVWNPAAGFVPIGAAAPFTGTLDGGGHTLANLTIARGGSDNVGLFAGIGNTGAVRNLTLAGGSVAGGGNVGALAGYSIGTVTNVSVSTAVNGTGSVGGLVGYNLGSVAGTALTGASVSAANFAGGLVGYNVGAVSGAVQANVAASGSYAGGLAGYNDRGATLSGSFTGTVTGHDYAGGVAGFSGGTIATASGAGTVTATRGAGGLVGFNTGTITGSSAAATVSAADLAGGFVGVNFGTIAGQSTTSTVTGGTQLGGFAGANASGGTLTNVSASGSVTGTGTLGGLVGYNDGAIATSFATGTVGGSIVVGGAGANFAGGLVGYNARTIVASYATGNVTGSVFVGGLAGYSAGFARIANSAAYSNVSGLNYAGGLAGYNGGLIDSSQANSVVSASQSGAGGLVGYNLGKVTHAFANGSVAAPGLSGGLVGLNFGTITLSYANAATSGTDSVGGLVGSNVSTITNAYATGAVSGSTQVGGLIGYNGGPLSDVYATGAVSGGDASTTGGLLGFSAAFGSTARGYASGAVAGGGGGVAGTNNGTLSAISYDAGTTGAAQAVTTGNGSGTAAVGGTTGRSAYAQASYPGLNFLDVWTIQQGQSRPTLQDNPQNPAPR